LKEDLVKVRIAKKRFEKRIRRERKQKKDRYNQTRRVRLLSYGRILEKYLPSNVRFLLFNRDSILNEYELSKVALSNQERGTYYIPETFSLVRKPEESFFFLKSLFKALVFQKHKTIVIDYSKCKYLGLDAQVLMDIIIKEILTFYKVLKRKSDTGFFRTPEVLGTFGDDDDIDKLLFSVGSFVLHAKKLKKYSDIIRYPLCIFDKEKSVNAVKSAEQKDIDTTKLVEYVLDCLKRMKITLTPERIEDLCTVIGEILINAEEHSTTSHRFSIGYFKDVVDENSKHYGIFNLVILNFGETIYQKFKQNPEVSSDVISKMKRLSQEYTSKSLFSRRKFEEETLWTLYALQEGVTSTSKKEYKKRGNGSIRFIESFFNIKGTVEEQDSISKMAILSGHTKITFDGKYGIKSKAVNGEMFKVMTFNESGRIEDLPDNEYIEYVPEHFPGTLIAVKLLIEENDIRNE